MDDPETVSTVLVDQPAIEHLEQQDTSDGEGRSANATDAPNIMLQRVVSDAADVGASEDDVVGVAVRGPLIGASGLIRTVPRSRRGRSTSMSMDRWRHSMELKAPWWDSIEDPSCSSGIRPGRG